ncbi:MAG: TROVE domain-containing protein [Polyangiaceae bacterium]|nr:TROVE domain-containing protein [Polyangiaceae bacterium]
MNRSYTRHLVPAHAPQSAPCRDDQVQNGTGGYVFALDAWARLDRFLVLGCEGGTYYASERTLTEDNARGVLECLALDGRRTIERIAEISASGRAPKNDPAIFALALAASLSDAPLKAAAFEAMPRVCRTATHLFQFVRDVRAFRSWGRGLRRAIGRWYTAMSSERLALQVAKYGQRVGYAHRDLLRLAHPKAPSPAHDAIFRWATGGGSSALDRPSKHGAAIERSALPSLLDAFEAVRAAKTSSEVVSLVRRHRLTHEMVPSEWKDDVRVWAALVEEMPLTALIRNLGKMTAVGLLRPLAESTRKVATRLRSKPLLRSARVHPLSVLAALKVYAQGHGERGKLRWEPVREIYDALEDAFYAAFALVKPTNVRHLLALDVSGSMTCGEIAGMPGMNPRVASAAMAMATARTEPHHHFVGFSHEIVSLDISPRSTLEATIHAIERVPMGATDCALPMLYAKANKLPVDVFIVYTDNETWFGAVHPFQALRDYRDATGIPAKLVVVGLTATEFSIADPNDAGMLDVVGFDAAAPALIADLAAA